jgi:hypothetical protein
MGRPDPIPAEDRERGTEAGNTSASNRSQRGRVRGLAPVAPEPVKCRIEVSDYFDSSIAEIARSLPMEQSDLEQRIGQFYEFKIKNGNIAFTMFGEDKESGVNATGDIYRPFRDDNHWHCHLGSSGDPMIAYRVLGANYIRLVCITTHRLNFAGRRTFVRQHAAEFPKTIRRQPRFRS